MILSNEQYERIQQFLDADMTLEEMDAFEKELTDNPGMQEQLNFEQSVRERFTFKKNKEGENKILRPVDKKFTKEKMTNSPVNTLYKTNWIAIAVAASVLTVIITQLVFVERTPENQYVVKVNDTLNRNTEDTTLITKINSSDSFMIKEQATSLYKQYFTIDSLPENYPIYLAEAFTNYDTGNYGSLEKLNLSDLPETRTIDDKKNKQQILQLGHYYKGIAFLKTNNAEQAIVNLRWVQQHADDANLKLNAEWYLALAYLKIINVNEAESLLKKLAGKSRYSSSAKSLLKALEE